MRSMEGPDFARFLRSFLPIAGGTPFILTAIGLALTTIGVFVLSGGGRSPTTT